jgi:hypothetical protein
VLSHATHGRSRPCSCNVCSPLHAKARHAALRASRPQVNAASAGLLLGSALCVILPEGFEALHASMVGRQAVARPVQSHTECAVSVSGGWGWGSGWGWVSASWLSPATVSCWKPRADRAWLGPCRPRRRCPAPPRPRTGSGRGGGGGRTAGMGGRSCAAGGILVDACLGCLGTTNIRPPPADAEARRRCLATELFCGGRVPAAGHYSQRARPGLRRRVAPAACAGPGAAAWPRPAWSGAAVSASKRAA